MQVQTNSCSYYPSNASLGTDSNNSSPESFYIEQSTSMDLSSPLPTHHNVQANRQHQLPSAKLQNFQAKHAVANQYYAHQNFDGSNGYLTNGSYNVNEQQRTRCYPQQQQQHHQVYAQAQLLTNEQQTYSVPTATYGYAHETANLFAQSVAVGKQRQQAAVNRARNSQLRNKKRKATDDGDVTMQITKIAKLEEPTTIAIEEGIDDIEDRKLTASQRERQRTQELNKAYSQLRQAVPCLPSDKLSKIQTVKLAKQYIEFLTDVLYSNAMPYAMKQANTNSKPGVLMAVRDMVDSAKLTPSAPPSREKLSYAFSVWRMDNQMIGSPRHQ